MEGRQNDRAVQQSDEPDKVRAANGAPRPLQVIRVLARHIWMPQRLNSRLLVIACATAVCAYGVRGVLACDCVGPAPIPEAFAAADAVFIAEVVTVQPGEPLLGRVAIQTRRLWAMLWLGGSAQGLCQFDQGVCEWDRSKRSALVIRARVIEAFKGSLGAQVSFYTRDSSGCGYPFLRGKQYVVYASLSDPFIDEPVLATNGCSRTRGLEEAQDTIEALRSLARGSRKQRRAG